MKPKNINYVNHKVRNHFDATKSGCILDICEIIAKYTETCGIFADKMSVDRESGIITIGDESIDASYILDCSIDISGSAFSKIDIEYYNNDLDEIIYCTNTSNNK